MRISTTNHAAHTAPKRPARPSAPQKQVELTDENFGQFQLNRPRPRPAKPAVPSTPPTPRVPRFGNEGVGGSAPGLLPLQPSGGGTFTFDPTAPRAPLQLAPAAPGFVRPSNFGPAPGAGWAAAANLVAQG